MGKVLAAFTLSFVKGLAASLPWALGLIWAAFVWGQFDGMSFWLRAPIAAAAFFLGRFLASLGVLGLTILGSLVFVSVTQLIEKIRSR